MSRLLADASTGLVELRSPMQNLRDMLAIPAKSESIAWNVAIHVDWAWYLYVMDWLLFSKRPFYYGRTLNTKYSVVLALGVR